MITILHRGGYAQMITILHRGGGGSLGTPKSDYVIYILACQKDKVKQGIDCSLTLPHKKGRVTTVFKLVTPNARQSLSVASPPKPGLRRSSRKGRRGKKEERRSFLSRITLQGRRVPTPFFNIVPKHSQSREPLQGLFWPSPLGARIIYTQCKIDLRPQMFKGE